MILSSSGVVKLCDYGSATTRVVKPTEDWTHQQRAMLEDEVFTFNTLSTLQISYIYGIFTVIDSS